MTGVRLDHKRLPENIVAWGLVNRRELIRHSVSVIRACDRHPFAGTDVDRAGRALIRPVQ